MRVEAAERAEKDLAAHAGGAAEGDDLRDLLQLAADVGAGEGGAEAAVAETAEHAIELETVFADIVGGLDHCEAAVEGEDFLERLGACGGGAVGPGVEPG